MTSRVVVSLRVPCSPIQAFDIFTQEIDAWWADTPTFRFTPRSPGQLAFEAPAGDAPGRLVERLPNGKVFEVGPVRDWRPGERLVVGWRQATFGPDQVTEVEVRFEPVGVLKHASPSNTEAGTASHKNTSRGTGFPSSARTSFRANNGARASRASGGAYQPFGKPAMIDWSRPPAYPRWVQTGAGHVRC
jgi:hypothetical protein